MMRYEQMKNKPRLFYFKYYPVQEVQGYLFGMGQPQANEWVHRLTPVLNRALGAEQQLPRREASTIRQVLAACLGLKFILDGMERPIRRPHEQAKQEQHYSDKNSRKIKALSPTVPGSKHDKKLANEQGLYFPPGS